MDTARSGSSLCEVLLALVLIATSAGWALQAASATERAIGTTGARLDAMHRATFALAELHTLPCDTSSATRTRTEPRWHLMSTRTTAGPLRLDAIVLHSRLGDTITTSRRLWCAP